MPWPWEDDSEDGPQAVAQRRFDPEALSPELRTLVTRPYLPQPDEIDAVQKQQQQEAQHGLLSTILSLPEKLLFGQAIKGAVKGGAEGGFGGAAMGFLRGTPFAYVGEALTGLDLYDETRFSDIRRAFGDTSSQEGIGNTVLNLMGELALSPLELLANPFGITTKGAAQVAEVGAKVGMSGKFSVAALKEAVDLGNRAALVLKVPFTSIAFSTNLGFKSGFTLLGGLLDGVGSVMRTNPATKWMYEVFGHSAGIRDPKLAAFQSELIASQSALRNSAGDVALKTFREKVSVEGQKLALDQGYAGLWDTLARGGIGSIDEAGSLGGIEKYLAAPDVGMRAARRNARLAADDKFNALWTKAEQQASVAGAARSPMVGEIPGYKGDPVDAIKTLYDNHPTVPLTDEMLSAARLPARPGVELSWIEDKSLGEKLADAVGNDAMTLGMAQRSDIGAASKGVVGAVQAARKESLDQWTKLKSAIDSGQMKWSDVNSFLDWHKQTLIAQGKAEIEVGALSETLEPVLGIYAPGITNPKVAQAINDRVLSVFRENNYAMPRQLTDMTAMEANAVMRDFGSKATGFIPTKELAEQGADGVLKRIFDTKFIRRLHKIDPKAAELFDSFATADDFFRISPVQNVIERVQKGANRIFTKQTLMKALQDGGINERSPLVKDVFTLGEVADMDAKVAETLLPGSEYQLVIKGRGGVKGLTREEAVSKYVLKPEHDAAIEVASHAIKDDFYGAVNRAGANHERLLDELDQARNLHAESIPGALEAKEGELLASRRIKDSVREVQAAKENLAEAQAIHAAHGRIGEVSASDPDLASAYNRLRDKYYGGEVFTKSASEAEEQTARDVLDYHSKLQSRTLDRSAGKSGVVRNEGIAAGVSEETKAAYEAAQNRWLKTLPNDAPTSMADFRRFLEKEVSKASKATSISGKTEEGFASILKEYSEQASSSLDFVEAKLEELRNAASDLVDKFHSKLDEVTKGFGAAKGSARASYREGINLLKGSAEARQSLVQRMKEAGVDARSLINEQQLHDQYLRHGATALDEAKGIALGKEGSLYDRIMSRADPNTKIYKVRREDWKAFQGTMDDIAKPDPFRNNGMARFLDRTKAAWAVHTAMNPLFVQTRVRNMMQNMVAAGQAGLLSWTGQREGAQVAKALSELMKGSPEKWNALDAGLRASADEALKRGVLKLSPVYATEMGLNAEQWLAKSSDASLARRVSDIKGMIVPEFIRKNPSSNVYTQWASRLETGLDNYQRFAAFRGGLKKGLSVEDAAGAVRRAMYDSKQPMTWTERTLLRRVIPFYSFQKYAFQNVAEMYLSKPGALSWLEKLRTTAAESPPGGGDKVSTDDATFLPPFIKDNFGVVSRNTPQGPMYRLFGAYFPVGEVSALANAIDEALGNNEGPKSGQGLIRYAMSKMHPALKTVMQQVWMKDFYSDRPLEDFPGDSGEMYGVVMSKRTMSIVKNIRFLNELDKLNVFNASEAKAMVNAVTREVGEDRPQQDLLSRFMQSAFSPVPVPQERLIDPVRESRFRQIKDEEQRRRDKGRLLRLIAAPDSLPARQQNLDALRQDYAETTARMRRRAEVAKPFIEESPTRGKEPRINLMR